VPATVTPMHVAIIIKYIGNDFDKAEVMAEARAWMADPKNAKYTDKSKWK